MNIIPAGGLSGVCGGTVPHKGGVIVDLKRMNNVIDFDVTSALIEVEAGILGSVFEEYLNEKGYTLGHFPSSISCSTIGGYAATRSAGQYSSKYGKFEDMVVGGIFIKGDGELLDFNIVPGDSRDFNPLYALLGSEGTMGIFTSLRLKVWPVEEQRIFAGFTFKNLREGLETMRNIMQAGLTPTVMRLYDPLDTLINKFGGGDSQSHEGRSVLSSISKAIDSLMDTALEEVLAHPGLLNSILDITPLPVLLILGYEGNPHNIARYLNHTHQIVKKNKGHYVGPGPGERWYRHRYSISFKQSGVFSKGAFVDTIEVSGPWSRIYDIYKEVRKRVGNKVVIMAHFSHAYREGGSVYFTFAGYRKSKYQLMELYQSTVWDILQATVNAGGTVSHHHGVGLMKREFTNLEYKGGDRLFNGLKRVFDPNNIMNPGKVYPPSTTLIESNKEEEKSLKDFMSAASYFFRVEQPNIIKITVPEEVPDVLRFAIKYGMKVAVQSHCSPKEAKKAGIVYLDMMDMDEIIKLDPISGIVTTQAGVTLRHLESFLNQKGFTLGIVPSKLHDVCMGKYVSIGGSRTYSPLYGELRDLIVGMSGYLSDGTPFRAKPAPRRSVGPDMIGLFVGSQGRYGIITGLCLKVFHLSSKVQYLAFGGDRPSLGLSAYRAALCQGARPADAVMVIRSPDRTLTEGRFRLILRFDGNAEDVAAQIELTRSILEAAGLESQRVRKKVKDWSRWGRVMYDNHFTFSQLLDFVDALPDESSSHFPDTFITGISKHGARAIIMKREPIQIWPKDFADRFPINRYRPDIGLKKALDPDCRLNCCF